MVDNKTCETHDLQKIVEELKTGKYYLVDQLHILNPDMKYIGIWKSKNNGHLFEDTNSIYLFDYFGDYVRLREIYSKTGE